MSLQISVVRAGCGSLPIDGSSFIINNIIVEYPIIL